MMEHTHIPVLLESTDPPRGPVIDHLSPKVGETVVDCTVGLGGHAEAMLHAIGSTGTLYAIDADPDNLRIAEERLHDLPGTKHFLHANFRDLPALRLPPVDILFADLGVSSPHLDDPDRGFTYRSDAPLDLRYDRSQGRGAAEFLAGLSEEDIVDLFREFGELRGAQRLAACVVRASRLGRLERTTDLVRCAEEAYGFRAVSLLPQVFQALRIAMNDELGALQSLLQHGPVQLATGGRMGVIAYHSLEDRLVKQAFRILSTPLRDPEKGSIRTPAPYELLTKRPVRPTDGEIRRNPRARSARFRVLRRKVLP